jgi:hypothetical protein
MSDVTRRVLTTVVVLACVAGLAFAVARTRRGDEEVTLSGSPDIVELLSPQRGSTVLRQAQILADLSTRWTGRMLVNGVDVTDELRVEPALNQLIYEPGPGKRFETLPAGTNCVVVLPYLVGRDPSSARSPIEWCFEVT